MKGIKELIRALASYPDPHYGRPGEIGGSRPRPEGEDAANDEVFGNDGTATEKQIAYAKQLMDSPLAFPEWSDDPHAKNKFGFIQEEARRRMGAMLGLQVVVEREDEADFDTKFTKPMLRELQDWRSRLKPEAMSRGGISKFIDAMKVSTGQAWITGKFGANPSTSGTKNKAAAWKWLQDKLGEAIEIDTEYRMVGLRGKL